MQQALDLAAQTGFATESSTPAVGRLLAVLGGAVSRRHPRRDGHGLRRGRGLIASALPAGATFVTIEADAERAAAVRPMFAALLAVRVLTGDWQDLLADGPFDLLFADGGPVKAREPETLLGALMLGGMLVLDDLTPEAEWPAAWRGQPDPVRAFWLNDPRVIATEIGVEPGAAAILQHA